jgi:hypothetical protein
MRPRPVATPPIPNPGYDELNRPQLLAKVFPTLIFPSIKFTCVRPRSRVRFFSLCELFG